MYIDDQLILKLEGLAKLKLSTEEREKLKFELDKILDMFSKISEVDTEGVAPLVHITDTVHLLRDDTVGHHIKLEDVKQSAPLIKDGFFAVPKVIE
jgi:aspartyl-tRNA(Asn)/glutamyl-tRNA(Gln) amidotransferase subunit C